MMKKRAMYALPGILLLAGLLAFAGKGRWWQMKEGQPAGLNGPDELRKLYERHQGSHTSLNIPGQIRLYDAEQHNLLKEETPFSYERSGTKAYGRLGYLQTFVADSIVAQLDTINHRLALSKLGGTDNGIFPFEKLLKDTTFKTSVTVEDRGGERSLSIASELSPEVRSCTVIYDAHTYEIRSAEMAFWKEGLVTKESADQKKFWLAKISYRYGSVPPTGLERRIDGVVTVRNSRIEGGAPYKNYSLSSNF